MSQTSGTKSGVISAQNANPNTGVATANSAVELDLGGKYNYVGIQVTGTYTGALTAQVSVDGSRYESIGGTVVGNSIEDTSVGTAAATIASAAVKVYRLRVSGMNKVRITALAAVTGSANVTLLATN